ncbi:dimethylaniline monooxygenase [N-oxide-forming] 2-like [Glandiceps talaboti]
MDPHVEHNKKRVAVIGAGVSGLVAIKSCVEEGLIPVCFEQHDNKGGVWYYTPELRPGQVGAVYRSVITNVTKELLGFSDFRFPKEAPLFPTNTKIYSYLKDYSRHFGLDKYINYNRRVMKVNPSPDHNVSGKWDVEVQDCQNDNVQIETFDFVMMCTSGFGEVYTPAIPGFEDFQGMSLHANSYREPDRFRGKSVIVVGASHTAGELSCELGRNHCAKVYMSVRNGTIISPRLTKSGWPYGMLITNRAYLTFLGIFRNRIMSDHYGDNGRFGLAPRDPNKPISFMSNDDMQTSIAAGHVTIIPEISQFTKNGVILSDGRVLADIDVVIFATGYSIAYKALDEAEVFDKNGFLKLYKYIIPVDLKHPSLAIIGVLQTFIPSAWNTLELQARWGARVFSKRLSLPDKSKMIRDIQRRPLITKHYKVLACTMYQDELARDIGALPSIWKLLFTDWRLAYAYYFGPAIGSWYRLQGPASWKGARDAILNTWANTIFALNPVPQ